MEILNGQFYATDHVNGDGVVETNILHVLEVRQKTGIEAQSYLFMTETMFVVDGKFDSICKNDWLPEFFKREATKQEIDLFLQHKTLNPELKHWAEHVTGMWIS